MIDERPGVRKGEPMPACCFFPTSFRCRARSGVLEADFPAHAAAEVHLEVLVAKVRDEARAGVASIVA
jgi:hypothetical protein